MEIETDRRPPLLIVAGPTASGKSALALAVAEAFGGTVINADSMQVYRELRVLTARPTLEDEARVPHRLFGVLPAAEACSAGRWLGMAVREIERTRTAGRLPVVVGGTGLYLKALTEGLSPIPDIPTHIREDARDLHARLGGAAFRAALAQHDPESAAALPAGDRQRLIRAYEVVRATGRPVGAWRRARPPIPPLDVRSATIVLAPPSAVLNTACEARFQAMMAQGALDEVRTLRALGLAPTLPAMKAVGVRELGAYLEGDIPLDEAVAAAVRATRAYAKRQRTWLRHQIVASCEICEQFSINVQAKIFSFIRRFLLTGAR